MWMCRWRTRSSIAASRTAKGRALVNVLPLREGERIAALSERALRSVRVLLHRHAANIDRAGQLLDRMFAAIGDPR